MAEIREVNLLDLGAVLEALTQEVQQEVQRLNHEVVNDCVAYFEAVRQRMPALTGNAASAVTFAVSEAQDSIEVVIAQEQYGLSGDDLTRYMPAGILTRDPHVVAHSQFETSVAMAKVGHVIVNPNARRDPWSDAARELGWTNFQRDGANPAMLTATPPSVQRRIETV